MARGRVYFMMMPGRGKMEINDPTGRLVLTGLWTNEAGWLVLPSEKVYWEGKGKDADIIAKLIGFSVSPEELLLWIIGRTEGMELFIERGTAEAEDISRVQAKAAEADRGRKKEKDLFPDWVFEFDALGRLWRGRKANLVMTITERWKNSPSPRVIEFFHPEAKGRLTVLGLEFNQTFTEHDFSLDFTRNKEYRQVKWAELEELMRLKKVY